MPFDDVFKSPLVGKVLGKLLSGEGLATGLQTIVSGATQARQGIEKGVAQALHAANLPSRADVAALKAKLEELEAMIDGLAERVDRGRGGNGGGGE